VALHAVVASFANAADKAMGDAVYSSRVAKHGRSLTRPGVLQWKRWIKTVRRQLKRHPFMIKTDLVAYFDTIRHDLLLAELLTLGVPQEVRNCLATMLQRWSPLLDNGLLQGPDACRILGNIYLLPVDAAMLAAGVRYSRYMDDIRILGRTKAEAIAGVRLLELEARRRGLILSASKTKFLYGKEARDSDSSKDRDAAEYFMRVNDHESAARTLERLFSEAFPKDGELDARQARFSFYRLNKLRDDRVLDRVLADFDDLAPVAPQAVLYLARFINRPAVMDGISAYLQDANAVGHDFLLYHLFALLLEQPSATAPQEWASAASVVMRDNNRPVWLRGIAANVAARSHLVSDISYIRNLAKGCDDAFFTRFLLVALARARALDEPTARACTATHGKLGPTVLHLRALADFPSLVLPRGRAPF